MTSLILDFGENNLENEAVILIAENWHKLSNLNYIYFNLGDGEINNISFDLVLDNLE